MYTGLPASTQPPRLPPLLPVQISPVWYQLRANEGGGFKLTGGHDVDQGWIARLREPVDSSSSSEQCSSDGAGGETCGVDDTATSRVGARWGAAVASILWRLHSVSDQRRWQLLLGC
jgi:hypothetical protein